MLINSLHQFYWYICVLMYLGISIATGVGVGTGANVFLSGHCQPHITAPALCGVAAAAAVLPSVARESTNLALMRYCAALIVSGVPIMVTLRSVDPSSTLAILMLAPDNCLQQIHSFVSINQCYNNYSKSNLSTKFLLLNYSFSNFISFNEVIHPRLSVVLITTIKNLPIKLLSQQLIPFVSNEYVDGTYHYLITDSSSQGSLSITINTLLLSKFSSWESIHDSNFLRLSQAHMRQT